MKNGIRTVVAQADDDHPRNTEAGVLPLTDGRLLLAYSRFHANARDDSQADIAAVTSADGGRTWSEPFVLQPNTGKMNVMSPSLKRLADGSIGFLYLQKDGHDKCTAYFKRSPDETATWSDPVRASVVDGYTVVVNDSLAELSSGRILVPTQNAAECWSDREHYVAFACYSDDKGVTWNRSANIVDVPRRGAMEPCIVERSDGTLLMNIRTQLGRMYCATSDDGGRTWSSAYDSGVESPESPSHMVRIPNSSALLLVWNPTYVPDGDHGGPRRPLVAALSVDDGASWGEPIVLESDSTRTYAYPSVAFLEGDALVTYYETAYQMGLGTDAVPKLSLVFRRFPLTELGHAP